MAREQSPAGPGERGHNPDVEEDDKERAVKQLMRHLLSKPPEPRAKSERKTRKRLTAEQPARSRREK